ncbi:MAG: hypothetical protein ACJ79R_10790 [Anaeromyxobacteraceae bacterium]
MHRKLLSLAVLALALAAPAARAELQWSDNSFAFRYGTAFREPANPDNIAKSILNFTHADGYKWGSNFLTLDLLYSNTRDPVQGAGAQVASVGAAEVYAVYRNTISLNKVTSSSKFALGPVRDLGITLGVDANTKNHGFSARKVMPIGGIQLALDVPGFLNVGLLANKEWAVNGINGKSVEFDITPTFAASWGIPVYGPVSFEGFGSVNLPKGKDGFGGDTVTEVLLRPKLMLDVGTLWGSKGYQVGVGYEYWLNKFGNDHDKDTKGGSFARTVFGELAIHL